RLQIDLNVPTNLPECQIPPSTLQPIIENCVEHGLKKTRIRGKISLDLHVDHDLVTFVVKDNGCGFSDAVLPIVAKKPLQMENGGTGLYNVNQRLISLLGEEAALKIENLDMEGAKVSFQIPAIENEKAIGVIM